VKKSELEFLLSYIVDICDGEEDPYAEDYERFDKIRDLCAQAVGREEHRAGAFQMPVKNKPKRQPRGRASRQRK
jgi:hypothetical protein